MKTYQEIQSMHINESKKLGREKKKHTLLAS